MNSVYEVLNFNREISSFQTGNFAFQMQDYSFEAQILDFSRFSGIELKLKVKLNSVLTYSHPI